MKLYMVQSVSWYYYTAIFDKPLNPILGETHYTIGADGAKIFLEQTEHHPPTSHFIVDGPDDNYKFTGWLSFSIKSGLTQSNLKAKGYKEITFKDGQKIRHNYFDDIFYNILMGVLGHQLTGSLEYVDEANDIVGTFTVNPSRWLAQDHFTGEIKVRGEKVSDIKGNYMGYFDIDGVRYWDIRDKD